MDTSNIQSILPLTSDQQALLFNFVRYGKTYGVLQVECVLGGHLDGERLKRAWQDTVQRHEALRSTIHWKEIEKPVQVVRKKVLPAVDFHDWSGSEAASFEERFEEFKVKDFRNGLDIEGNAPMRLAVFRKSDTEHILLWTCNHIFADGWSASITLRDLIEFYSDKSPTTPTAKLEEYRKWYDRRDLRPAEDYWKSLCPSTPDPTLIASDFSSTSDRTESIHGKLSSDDLGAAKEFARSKGLTLATVVHGAWAIVLSRLRESDEVFFGTTSSGRTVDVAGVENSVGMFSTVLPVRVDVSSAQPVQAFFDRLQAEMARIRSFEFFKEEWISDSGVPTGGLFDSFLVFENIPFFENEDSKLELSGFRSGIVSGFPVTVILRPNAELEIDLEYLTGSVDSARASWLVDQLLTTIRTVARDEVETVGDVKKTISQKPTPAEKREERESSSTYARPISDLEIRLTRIWESSLDKSPIGLDDDFFEIGGRSINAVRIFSAIKETLGRNLSPVMLIESPTIRKLASAISQVRSDEESWTTLVPLNLKGSKPPLFCLHAGGGYVMFYKSLADRLEGLRPVYGVQPVGLDGVEKGLETVEKLADFYLREIKTVQPEGPYSILGYCFSSTVCIELGRKLIEQGEKVGKIIIVDSPPMHRRVDVEGVPGIAVRARSYVHIAKEGNWREIRTRLKLKAEAMAAGARSRYNNLIGRDPLPELPSSATPQEILSRAYQTYEWRPYEGDLTLIMAGPVEKRPWSEVEVRQWRPLVNGELTAHFIDADHTTIFDEPDVSRLAIALEECLSEVR